VTALTTDLTGSAAPLATRWWVLAVMSLTTFMVFLDNTVVNTALPSIARDLNASTATLQWVIDGYTLVLATGGLFAIVYAIIQGNEAGWTSPEIVAAFSSGVSLLAAFAIVEVRSASPMLPLRFFRQRDFNGGVLVIGLIFFAMMVTFFFLT
jgi:MFS family permease